MFLAKSEFKLVPEGERRMLVEKIELLPTEKNVLFVKTTFVDTAGGGRILDTCNLSNPIGMYVLRSRFDVATDNKYKDMDEIDSSDIVKAFEKKIFMCNVVHREGKGANEGKQYANINRVISLCDTAVGNDLE